MKFGQQLVNITFEFAKSNSPKTLKWEKLNWDNISCYSSKFFQLAGLAQTGFGIFLKIFFASHEVPKLFGQ